MFRNLFANIPDVTKNLLILNGLFFLATFLAEGQGIDFRQMLGVHYPSSPLFEPYQLITHFFMHGDLFHILFNMIGLVVFGSQLERVWGKKRFFIFYVVTAIGAMILHTAVQGFELYQLTGEFFPTLNSQVLEAFDTGKYPIGISQTDRSIVELLVTTTLGASGAVYGLLMGFAMLFPNTQLMLLFPPIPIKAKWLAAILAGIALYQGYMNNAGDSVAHFAHLGGMIFGFFLIRAWKNDRQNFY